MLSMTRKVNLDTRDHGPGMKNSGAGRDRGEVDALRRGNMGRSRLCRAYVYSRQCGIQAEGVGPTKTQREHTGTSISHITNARIYINAFLHEPSNFPFNLLAIA